MLKTPLLYALLATALLCGWARGQQAPAPNGERTIDFGFEQRVRNENWNNLFDFSNNADDEREQIRYRTRFWAKVPVSSTIDFFAGANAETNQRMAKPDNHFDEVGMEAAYVDFKKVFVNGLSLRVGRQNLMRGEGFLFFEGTPGDGSRNIYFNAFDLAYTRKKARLELIGILNPPYDRFMPRISDERKLLQDWYDQSLGVYYTNNNSPKDTIEAYYFYTKEIRDVLARTNPQFQPDRHVSTLGGRLVHRFNPAWSVTGEYAYQWGFQRPVSKISAWGGYGYVKRDFKNAWKPYIQAGYWGMSGDDPNTKDRIEGWDPLFARWPKWSELYLYSLFKEQGVAYWSDIALWQAETGFTPAKKVSCRATYYHMTAFHPFTGDQKIFADGTNRGDLYEARVDIVANKNWRGHILWENVVPGSFYRVKDLSYFLRFEIIYQITASLHLK